MIPGVDGFMYPNEVELQWSLLIVLYPYITGLVAGAFILASLERVFKVEAVRPTYRLALLTALAFLLVAPLPLQLHLGHPERSIEMYLTPHTLLGHGHVRLCVPVVPDGGPAARNLAGVPRGHRAPGAVHHRVRRGSSTGCSRWGRRTSARRRGASTTRSATPSPSSASPRRFCCTATWDSSSARSRPIPGGPRRSCRSCSCFRRWFRASRRCWCCTWPS